MKLIRTDRLLLWVGRRRDHPITYDDLVDAETRCFAAEEKALELLEVVEGTEDINDPQTLIEIALDADVWEMRHRTACQHMRIENALCPGRWPGADVAAARDAFIHAGGVAEHARRLRDDLEAGWR